MDERGEGDGREWGGVEWDRVGQRAEERGGSGLSDKV